MEMTLQTLLDKYCACTQEVDLLLDSIGVRGEAADLASVMTEECHNARVVAFEAQQNCVLKVWATLNEPKEE